MTAFPLYLPPCTLPIAGSRPTSSRQEMPIHLISSPVIESGHFGKAARFYFRPTSQPVIGGVPVKRILEAGLPRFQRLFPRPGCQATSPLKKVHSPSSCRLNCWIFQRLTSRVLASSRWLTPLASSALTYSFCLSVKTVGRPGKRPSARAMCCPAMERSLMEFRYHSEKASTVVSCSLPFAVEVSKSSARDRNSTPLRWRSSVTWRP